MHFVALVFASWHGTALSWRAQEDATALNPHVDSKLPSMTGASSVQWSEQAMICVSGPPAITTKSMTFADYDHAQESISTSYKSLPKDCNATYCPQADWSGCVLRVAGHDFMDFTGTSGGADGCLDMHDPDNLGLHACLYEGEFGVSLLDSYQEFCTRISLADFIVIAAEVVMNLTRCNALQVIPGGLPVDFRSRFKYGRTTSLTCPWSRGRLPNPESGCSAVRATFVEAMGLNWAQSAALMGVHTLGRASLANSGYEGWWSDAESSRRFNNNYFWSILNKGWMPEVVAENYNKNQWVRSDVGRDINVHGKEMMLNTDLCLAFSADLDGHEELNAGRHRCCAWRFASDIDISDYTNFGTDGDFCGSNQTDTELQDFLSQRAQCCGTIDVEDCGNTFDLRGPAYQAVKLFSLEEEAWLHTFMVAWQIATLNGYPNLTHLS
mmetsp:Transcript_45869/g.91010  ORF Transcript_45869/g.91010 Transcript_45869/m.91010 type:complete len:439 (-) Transcript_45869:228-1544(-)